MKRARTLALFAALTAATAATAVSPRAHADPTKEASAAAQKLFEDALVLMRVGKYGDACPKLQQSQKLDPAMGTKYRLAECYEGAGLVGSAWAIFTEVIADARAAGRGDRESQARQHADALKPRLPMMTLVLPPAVAGLPGLEITRDGERIDRADWTRVTPVDPGSHTIVVNAAGKKSWVQTVRSLEGGSTDVNVPMLDDGAATPNGPVTAPPRVAPAPPPAPPAPVPPPAAVAPQVAPAPPVAILPPPPPVDKPASGSGQRVAGIVVGVVGLLGVGAGAGMGAAAKSNWSKAFPDGCQGGDPTKCSASAIDHAHSASTLALGSTIGFIAGGAALVTGIVVLVTAPSKKAPSAALRLAPVLAPGVAAGAVEGRF